MKVELLRFFTIGFQSNLINYAIYLSLSAIGVPLIIASIIGYAGGLYNSYHFGRHWVFKSKQKNHRTMAFRFFVVYLAGGVGMAATIEIMERFFDWDYRLAWFIGAAFAFANNFLGSKFFVFKKGND